MPRIVLLVLVLVVALPSVARATSYGRITPAEMLASSDLVILADAVELKYVGEFVEARLRRVATYKGRSPDEVTVRWRELLRGESLPRLGAQYVAFLKTDGDRYKPAVGARSMLELRKSLIAASSLPAGFNGGLLGNAKDGKHAFEPVVFTGVWPFSTIDFGASSRELMLRGTDWTSGYVSVRAVMLSELELMIAPTRVPSDARAP